MRNRLAFVLSVLCLLMLSGCELLEERDNPAPVMLSDKGYKKGKAYHFVRQGETLYEIAFKYGLDYRDIAELNHIAIPYKIHPGQKLHLIKAKKTKNLASESRNVSPSINKGIWEWPVKGKLIKSFSEKGAEINKGIDIAGQLGDPVHAARAGKVVYAGEGLRGYGKLLIIKHDEDYLSAYAHNQTLLVKEGDMIQTNQIIAKMGKSDSLQVNLHFEIRYKGKPLDPLRFLSS